MCLQYKRRIIIAHGSIYWQWLNQFTSFHVRTPMRVRPRNTQSDRHVGSPPTLVLCAKVKIDKLVIIKSRCRQRIFFRSVAGKSAIIGFLGPSQKLSLDSSAIRYSNLIDWLRQVCIYFSASSCLPWLARPRAPPSIHTSISCRRRRSSARWLLNIERIFIYSFYSWWYGDRLHRFCYWRVILLGS